MSRRRALAGLASGLSTPSPSVAVEITPERVTAVALGREAGGPVIAAHATEPLPPGAVRPSVTAPNILEEAPVQEALGRLFERLGRRPRRVALVIPDGAGKVSLIRFAQVPSRAADLDQLVRWQVRKAAPFRVEDAQIAYVPALVPPEGGREFVVVVTRRDVVEQYERALARAGAYAGIVDLATFNLINLVLAAGPGQGDAEADWLLVHAASDSSTIAIVRDADLIFFRNRPAEADGSLADLVHQTAMYYEDRLGGRGFGRVRLAGGGAALDDLYRAVQDRLGLPVDVVDPRRAAELRDRIDVDPDLLAALAAPVGILLREQSVVSR